ncbi:DNA polymerase III subunit beta [Desulfurispirillum indicum]|uniref:Beta sliding clamp n=1 Tax=Desulfurispirillum indicum (strain ATCC BAA-1389 / DSM 22839 / S5) TaxID=653733 RepID=E6W483_DESIS|nr:DNA polymerase III subunit beta [Desulfurispirillum indicum]ADU64761.1 DNA polymerase III, beta subunit [Desulfurispirillum indicum S5]UCZ56695.1 DNA polymerase III subunit beta [Desulfurispirillum indicum]
MRFEIEKKDLEKTLFKAHGICNSKNITNNILTNIQIKAESDLIRINSTDRNISLTSTISANIQETGSVLVNGKKFYEAIKELPNNIVIIERVDNTLTIACQKTQFKLFTSDPTLFPELDLQLGESPVVIPALKLRDILIKTFFCSTETQTKFGVNGTLLKLQGNKITTVATDGHRLGLSAISTDQQYSDNEVVIPRNSLNEIVKVLTDVDEDIKVHIDENAIVFATQQDTIKTNLLKKKFPPYGKVIPDECPVSLQISTKKIKETLKRLSIFVNENVKIVKFSVEDKILVATIQSQEHGNAREVIEIEYEGNNFEIGYNVRLFNEIINHIESETFTLALNESLSVSVIRPGDNKKDEQTLYVLMPNRL